MRLAHALKSWPVYLFAALVPLAFTLVLATWYTRVDPYMHVSGLFQADMPTYLCNARAAIRSPTLLSYASPWDLRAEPRALLVQWPITLLGGILALGATPAQAELWLRLGAGFGMFVLLARMLRLVLPARVFFLAGLLTLSLGGGVAWIWALAQGADLEHLRRGIQQVQLGYYWWCVELFRNLMYPIELVQHCLVFAYLLALMRGQLRLALVLLALGASASPFVAVMLFGVHGIACALQYRSQYREHAVAALIAAWFVVQYKLLIAHDPVLGSIMTQHQSSARYNDSMSLLDTLTGYGLVLLIVPVLLCDWRFSQGLFRSRVLVPMFALAAWSLLLMQHSRFPHIAPMMPKHFTRGYAFVGLGALWFAWLQALAARWPRYARAAAALALVCVPLSLPDNLAFVVDQYHSPPDPPLLLWPRPTEQLLAYLRAQPGHMRILSDDPVISRQLCAMTEHRSMIATGLVTPEFDQRLARIRRFLQNPADRSALGDWRVDAVLLSKRHEQPARKLSASGDWQLAFENAGWMLFNRSR